MKKKFSIIIPVFNGEKHIKKCIDNIYKQKYDNYEVLVLNDGSKDKTSSILEKLQKKYNSLIVINKENTGVSDTRNLGVKNSNGEYILFLDSDDELETNALNTLAEECNKKNDMILFGFKVNGSNNRFNDTEVINQLIKNNASNMNILESLLKTNNNLYGYIWRGVYSKKFLSKHNISFPAGIKLSEDYMFLAMCLYYSTDTKLINDELYIYNIGESSMSVKYIPTLLNDMLFVNKWVYENIILKNNLPHIYYYCNMSNTYLRFVQNTVRNKTLTLKQKNIIIKIIKKKYDFKKYIKKVWYRKNLFTTKTFLSLILFNFNFEWLYVYLFNKKIKGCIK